MTKRRSKSVALLGLCTEENLLYVISVHRFSSLCLLRGMVGASGAPHLLGEPEDPEQRDLGKCQEGAVRGVAVFEPHQRQGRGSWRAEGPEHQVGTAGTS